MNSRPSRGLPRLKKISSVRLPRAEDGPIYNISTVLLMGDTSIPMEQKIRRAIKGKIALEPAMVKTARMMFLNGIFKDNKYLKYHISPHFYDPRMIPLPEFPGWEHNPSYPQEYPRKINRNAVIKFNQCPTKAKLERKLRRYFQLRRFFKTRAVNGNGHFCALYKKKKRLMKIRKSRRKTSIQFRRHIRKETKKLQKSAPPAPRLPETAEQRSRRILAEIKREMRSKMPQKVKYILKKDKEESRRWKSEHPVRACDISDPFELKKRKMENEKRLTEMREIAREKAEMRAGLLQRKDSREEGKIPHANEISNSDMQQCQECIDDMIGLTICQEIIPQLAFIKPVFNSSDDDWKPVIQYKKLDWDREIRLLHELLQVNDKVSKFPMFALFEAENLWWTLALRPFLKFKSRHKTIPTPGTVRYFTPSHHQPIDVFKVFITSNLTPDGTAKLPTDRYEFNTRTELSKMFSEELERHEPSLREQRPEFWVSQVLAAKVSNPFFVKHQHWDRAIREHLRKLAGYMWRQQPIKWDEMPKFIQDLEDEQWARDERREREDEENKNKRLTLRRKDRYIPPKLCNILKFKFTPCREVLVVKSTTPKESRISRVARLKTLLYRINKVKNDIFLSTDEQNVAIEDILKNARWKDCEKLERLHATQKSPDTSFIVGDQEKRERSHVMDDNEAGTSYSEDQKPINYPEYNPNDYKNVRKINMIGSDEYPISSAQGRSMFDNEILSILTAAAQRLQDFLEWQRESGGSQYIHDSKRLKFLRAQRSEWYTFEQNMKAAQEILDRKRLAEDEKIKWEKIFARMEKDEYQKIERSRKNQPILDQEDAELQLDYPEIMEALANCRQDMDAGFEDTGFPSQNTEYEPDEEFDWDKELEKVKNWKPPTPTNNNLVEEHYFEIEESAEMDRDNRIIREREALENIEDAEYDLGEDVLSCNQISSCSNSALSQSQPDVVVDYQRNEVSEEPTSEMIVYSEAELLAEPPDDIGIDQQDQTANADAPAPTRSAAVEPEHFTAPTKVEPSPTPNYSCMPSGARRRKQGPVRKKGASDNQQLYEMWDVSSERIVSKRRKPPPFGEPIIPVDPTVNAQPVQPREPAENATPNEETAALNGDRNIIVDADNLPKKNNEALAATLESREQPVSEVIVQENAIEESTGKVQPKRVAKRKSKGGETEKEPEQTTTERCESPNPDAVIVPLVRHDLTGFMNEPDPIQDFSIDLDLHIPPLTRTISISTNNEDENLLADPNTEADLALPDRLYTIDELAPEEEPTRQADDEIQVTEVEEVPAEPKPLQSKRGRPKKQRTRPACRNLKRKKATPPLGDTEEVVAEPIAIKRTRRSIDTGSIMSESSARNKRHYLSKNNPAPRIRAAEAQVTIPVRLTGVAPKDTVVDEEETSPEQIPETTGVSQTDAAVATIKSELPEELPPPHTATFRKSRKRQRAETQAKILKEVKQEVYGEPPAPPDPDLSILMLRIAMKQEDDEALDNCMIVAANYQVPHEPVALEEQPKPPKVVIDVEDGKPKHAHLLTRNVWRAVNDFFMSDPQRFSEIMLILEGDTEKRGRVFKTGASVVNRTSNFTSKFIDHLASSSKTIKTANRDLTDYNNFSSAIRERSSLLLTNHHITPLVLHQIIEKISEIKKNLREGCPIGLITENERDAMNATEQVMLGRYIESIMKLTAQSQLTWATEDHVKRRIELIFNGWKMFLSNGGFFRVLLAMKRDDVKTISETFRKYCEEYLIDIEGNFQKAIEYYEMSDEQLVNHILETAGVTREQLERLDEDVEDKQSKTHTQKCSRCFLNEKSVFFSSYTLLEIHEKLHEAGTRECGRCYDDYPAPELVMHRIFPHCSMRLQDDF
uniref:Uncharacterized protein n=1 Tax=Caenorhabditis japonica TaxID=281687 RepID=A0A8R1DGY2_CAEJA